MIDFTRLSDAEYLYQLIGQVAPRLAVTIIILGLFWLLLRFTRPALKSILARAGLHETLIHMIADNLYAAVVWAIAIVTAASQLGVNVTAALAGMGVAGVAFGFAAQDTVANMISGFLIFWDKPFRVQDFVTTGDQYGRVVEITMRSTRIRTQQNTYVVIPNKTIIDSILVNHTKHGEIRVDVPIGIAYKESIPEARRVMLAATRSVEGVLSEPSADVVCTALASSSVDLEVRVWIDEAAHERAIFYMTMEACKIALDEAGIQIPYHHLQLFVDDVEDRVWQKAAGLLQRGANRGGGQAA